MKYLGAVLINYEKTRMMVSKLWNVFRMLSQAMKDLGAVNVASGFQKTVSSPIKQSSECTTTIH